MNEDRSPKRRQSRRSTAEADRVAMSGFGYRVRWLRPGKVLEEYVLGGPWAPTTRDAEWQIYEAVREGVVRARYQNQIIDPQEFVGKKFSDDDPYALPWDIELNLDDVERVWNWDAYDLADLIATGRIGLSAALARAEVTLLNLQTLLDRLKTRLRSMSLVEALRETEFQKRWNAWERDMKLLQSGPLASHIRTEDFARQFERLANQRNSLSAEYGELAANVPTVRGKRGAPPNQRENAKKALIALGYDKHEPRRATLEFFVHEVNAWLEENDLPTVSKDTIRRAMKEAVRN